MAPRAMKFSAGPSDRCWVLAIHMPPSGDLRDLTPSMVYSTLIIGWQWGPMRRLVYPVTGAGLAPHNVAMLLPDGQVRHDMQGKPCLFPDTATWLEAIRRL
jgi:hypothetical protein